MPFQIFYNVQTHALQVIESNCVVENHNLKKQRVAGSSPAAAAPLPHLLSAVKGTQPAKSSQPETADDPPKSTYGEEAVGLRCKVFWSDDSTWYKGLVSQYDASKSRHLVEYDDGDTEWLNLGQEKIQLLQKPGEQRHCNSLICK